MTLTRTEIVARLTQLGMSKVGDPMPTWLPTNEWGNPLSELMRATLELLPIWRSIETAPIPTEVELVQRVGGRTLYNYRFDCLLQNTKGDVTRGHARYVQAQGNAQQRRWVLRWYSDGTGWEKNPRFWMPLPTPRED